MKKLIAAMALVMLATAANAADTCKSKAIDKNGKPLAGAAYNSFMGKCTKDAQAACDASAKSKDGKPLFGAAKASYTKKCVTDAVGG